MKRNQESKNKQKQKQALGVFWNKQSERFRNLESKTFRKNCSKNGEWNENVEIFYFDLFASKRQQNKEKIWPPAHLIDMLKYKVSPFYSETVALY